MANIVLAIVRSVALAKSVKNKAIPYIRAYACRECNSLASVSMQGNSIKVTKCNCK